MKTDVLGVKINTEPKSLLLQNIKTSLDRQKPIFIVTPYSESVVAAQKDSGYQELLNRADFALPDGTGILWAANYLKHKKSLLGSLLAIVFKPSSIRDPIAEKISGSSFIWDLVRLAVSRKESVFLLGGFGKTPERVAERLLGKFPDLKIAGTYAGSPAEEGIVERINQSAADYLFVAFGPEQQEKWISNNLNKLNIKLAIGLGGTFDYLAGNRAPAPKIWRLVGLEWLWRLITQPRRVRRVFAGVFGLIYHCFRYKVRYN